MAVLEKLWEMLPTVMLKDRWHFRIRLQRLQGLDSGKGWQQEYERLLKNMDASAKLRQERFQRIPQISYPEELPITSYRDAIVSAIQSHQVLIIAGETGSGKTTQLPKMCLQAGQGVAAKIGCTQPRRIAATSMTHRISNELNSEIGKAVGYKIRFSDNTSPHTFIQMMTDGILLNEIQQDRYLNSYDTLIVDEAHERSLNIDFLLGYLKRLLLKRPDLKLIISSANLDIPRFSKAFFRAWEPPTPVIEVSGRVYPVEVRYQPIDEELEEQGEQTICDTVVNSIREILDTNWQGNVLAFMPGEQEIREVLGRLESCKQAVEFLPLYGRLSNREQNRIFQNMARRKVIIATNIAETSLTIPGIRYVIDSGLARISRYSNRSHTQRLPVEAISKSSANQRKGRAGRLQSGVCIRLYSQETFDKLREFTEPEILRASLAEVILRMKSLGLGNISEFPFIDPPSAAAVREGITLLKELGALDDSGILTVLGKEMARLPIEPRIARMLLAARQEHALWEVLVIAAAISIQDPREFPLDKIEHARQMHSLFVDKTSDFLTLLNIWKKYHEEWEMIKSENKMRKFCKQHFLSFSRLREWRDIYRQLSIILSELPDFQLEKEPANYRSIHLAILSGYLHRIALKKENNLYRTTGDKEVMIFPGSGIFHKGRTWIVAAEFVETSRLFARMVADIEVDWLESIGKNLCHHTYSEPHFDSDSSSVKAYEKVTLYGLVIVPRRQVFFAKINPAEATSVFIREGLVEGKLLTHHSFFKHNLALKRKMIRTGAKMRRDYEFEVEAAMEYFYSKRLFNIASLHDLNGLLKQKCKERQPNFLFMTEEDFAPNSCVIPPADRFPDHWSIGEHQLRLEYQFAPEKDNDGVTLHIPENLLPYLDPDALDWLVPGHWEEKILYLLKGLPKRLRKQLVPLPQTVQMIAQELKFTHSNFLSALASHVYNRYGLAITPADWDERRLPEYLKIRVEIRDHHNRLVSEGRDVVALLKKGQKRFQDKNKTGEYTVEIPQWKEASLQWERKNVTNWSFNTLPTRITIPTINGIPLYAYPGLKADEEGIHCCLFHHQTDAQRFTKTSMMKLLALNAGKDIAWLDQDLQDLREFKELYHPFGNVEQLKQQARINLHEYLFKVPWIESKAEFNKALSQAQYKTKGLWPRFKKQLGGILQQYAETRHTLDKYLATPAFEEYYQDLDLHLDELMPADFAQVISFFQWRHIPRYLKGISIRAERLVRNPGKDDEKSENLASYQEPYLRLQRRDSLSESQKIVLEEFRWMLEEFKVSLFAPELKTAFPVSNKRLDKIIEKLHSPQKK